MKLFLVSLKSNRDVPTKAFIPAETANIAGWLANYWFRREDGTGQVLEIKQISSVA